MLVYLDALIAALSVRSVDEATRLLAHPLARLLPDEVRAEARGLIEGTRDTLASPLRTMQLRYRTAELLRDAPGIADQSAPTAEPPPAMPPPAMPPPAMPPPAMPPIAPPQLSRRSGRQPQIELPLSA